MVAIHDCPSCRCRPKPESTVYERFNHLCGENRFEDIRDGKVQPTSKEVLLLKAVGAYLRNQNTVQPTLQPVEITPSDPPVPSVPEQIHIEQFERDIQAGNEFQHMFSAPAPPKGTVNKHGIRRL